MSRPSSVFPSKPRLACGSGSRFLLLVVAAGAVLLGPPSRVAAQDPGEVRVGIRYTPGFMPKMAVSPVRAAPGLEAAAEEVEEILRRDLDYADRFELLPWPDSLGPGSAVNYGLWKELGAVWLVTADLSGSSRSPLLRVGLHDVVYGALENVRAFALPAPGEDGFRMAVHRASDRVVEWATGDPGIAATRIVFRRRTGEGSSDVFAVDSDGEGLERLTSEEGVVYSPSLSPDGGRLLYQVMRPDGTTIVYEKNLSSGRKRTVAEDPGGSLTPAYSPDGSRIAYARWTGSAYQIFEAGGGRITNTRGGDALNPTYSPDGRRVAYEATPLGVQQVYVQRTDGGPSTLISLYVRGERSTAAAPDWSPRGDRIAYAAWADGTYQIQTVNPDGTERRSLTSRGINEDPSWAPDGRHLVFSSEGRTGRALMVLDAVSGRIRTLTSARVDRLPDWSGRVPEGR